MNTFHRRYIFVDFDNLQKIKFKKLEKVCDRVFILINQDEYNIPFYLVQQMQKMGKGVKWITVNSVHENDINQHMCFLLGKMHHKVDKSVEFAIVSNQPSLDTIINTINSDGRSCLRVKRKPTQQELTAEGEFRNTTNPDQADFSHSDVNSSPISIDPLMKDEIVRRTAQQTIDRLIRSGNRPSEVDLLRDYIQLNHQEYSSSGNVDDIIRHLEDAEEIKIQGGEVIYNF